MRALFVAVLALAACGKAPTRTDFEVKNYEGDEAAVSVALSKSDARWCDEFYTFKHKTDPDMVLVECHGYKRPVESWVWKRGSYSASRHAEM